MTQVSVVVPTYRRPDLLKRCLEALLRQDLDAAAYEVIVADDAASNETRQLVQQFNGAARQPQLKYIPVHNTQGPAAARNVGWRAARCPIIAFTDDDCIPQPAWLRQGLAAMEESVAAVAGKVVMPLPARPTDYERDSAGLTQGEFVTANCFCRREVLEAIGGFDERFTSAWREDSDLHFSLLERGYAIRTAPEAVVLHPVRAAPWGVSLSQQRKTAFDALLYKKHPQLYRQRIPGVPRSYYLICGSLATAAAACIAAWWPLALASLATWAIVTGRFCAARLQGTSRKLSHVAEMIVTSALIPPLSLYWHVRGLWNQRILFL